MPEKIAEFGWDAFSRTGVCRRVKEANGATCAWCGNKRARKGVTLSTLFQYGVYTDSANGSKRHWAEGLFCCIDCRNTYQGE